MDNFNDYSLIDEFYNERGKYKLSKLDNASHTWSQKLDYEFVYSGQTYYPGQNKRKWENRQKGDHASKDWQWMWSKESLLKGIEQKQIVFKNNKIYSKRYQKVDHKLNPILRVTKNSNVIDSILNSAGTQEIKDLFNKKIFDHPKPSLLIKLLINLCNKDDALVLDFFAGSGTTGQAVMELNAKDGGNRRFILITNNESKERTEQEAKNSQDHPELGICRAVTHERLYRVINGKGSQNEKIKWCYSKEKPFLNNNAVRYLQVDYVHKITGEFEDIDKNKSLYKVEFDRNLSILDLK